jgi:phospholipid/cholesterol/gamma-HCH transport system permease protein
VRKAADSAGTAWVHSGGDWRLVLSGDWRGVAAASAGAASTTPVLDAGTRVRLDAQALSGWDAGTAPALWHLLAPLRRQGVLVELQALPGAMRVALELALPAPDEPSDELPPKALDDGALPGLRAWGRDALTTAAFVGEVLIALLRLLAGKAVIRWSDYARQLDLTGPMSLPIVSLTCFLIGLMLAYMGGAQLERIGGQSYIADVVTVGMVRELAGLMTGVILAGRVGAAFAAQLGTMKANEEIDALRALGIDPVEYLVLPRLLAMMTVAPLLIAYAALVGVLAGLPPVVGIYGVPAYEYLHKCLTALTWNHLWIGLLKGTVYIGLVALAGCREGLHAGRDAQAVGSATTTAVVKALVWIVVAASLSTVLFQSLGL